MKRAVLLWSLALACLTMGAQVSSHVLTGFDDGTLQGWTAVGDVQGITNPGSGGNPGGYIRLDDQALGDICWLIAPSEYLGNWHGKTTLSADLIQFYYSGSQIAPAEFRISGPGGSYSRTFGERPPAAWRTYGTTISEPLWTKISGSWDALMDDVTEFRIRMEFINGDEQNGLDNVSLTDVCSATTIGLAKQMSDGQCVTVDGVVSRLFTDATYVQSEDRSAGIRVKNSFALTEGDRVTVNGTLGTRGNERFLENATVLSAVNGSPPKPLHVLASQLGGSGATALDPRLGASLDLKETGLLIRTSGRVCQVNTDASFRVCDGSGVGSLAKCGSPIAKPRLGAIVGITGVSASDGQAEPAPTVLGVRDITVYSISTSIDTNLIQNNGAEDGDAGCITVVRPIPGWSPTSNFTVCNYGCDISVVEGERVGGGRNYFMGGPSNASSSAEQAIDLSPLADLIDAGQISATLSADLAGYQTQGDNAKVIATFYDASSTSLGQIQIGPQAGSNGQWVFHQQSGAVPAAARTVKVKMVSTRVAGSNNNGYFDNLSLVLTRVP